MHVDDALLPRNILPLSDAIVWAPESFWDDFPAELLDRRVTIANEATDLMDAKPQLIPAVIVLDDSHIHDHVRRIWRDSSLDEFVVVLPHSESHVANLKSIARISDLSEQLKAFARKEDLLALKFVRRAKTTWNLRKLLEAISILSPSVQKTEMGLTPELVATVVDQFEIFEHLIELTATGRNEILESESLEFEQLKEQNARLQSNNASMRLRIDALERKYDTLANSRLGKLTLRKWERK